MKFIIIITTSSINFFPACLAGFHEKALLHDLLDSYNTLERPVVNESDPLQLSFGLTLMQIIDVVTLKHTCLIHICALELMRFVYLIIYRMKRIKC